ncbi:MAG: isoprenylcysteine carboxylmethyltransferase family protein [Alphaproteobacteria bacterium]|nr:isoprenylcysteine carboxylmethyltransferase family protein [Alphaproteobacteria bacterium]MCD8570943.1 isoprenylcysteine carboxylmethyltransferase family protein [Alphaproteobacteria bacterium]
MGLFVLFGVFLTGALIQTESPLHETLDMMGIVFVAICALGRLYTTAYLGGSKNETLITEGPFSVVRNPLYVFSWIGFTGIALMTTHLVFIIAVPVFFAVLYTFLVRREEAFLHEKFGQAYKAYTQSVPRFIPNFANYRNPDDIKVNTSLFMNGALDAIWWFAAFPLVEFAEYVQEQGWLPALFVMP